MAYLSMHSTTEMTMVREVWMPAAGAEDAYEVSNLGRVVNQYGVALVPSATNGYLHVTLCLDGERRTTRLHRLILESFCGPPPFDGAEAAHNNGCKFDCALTNLRWATKVENQADIDRHGRRCQGEAVHNAVLTADRVREIRLRIALGDRNPAIAADFGVSISTIHLIRHHKIWKRVE